MALNDLPEIGGIRTLLSFLDRQRMSKELRELLDAIGNAIRAQLREKEAAHFPQPVGIISYPGAHRDVFRQITVSTALRGLRGVDWGDDGSIEAQLEYFSQKVQQVLEGEEVRDNFHREVLRPFATLQNALEGHKCTGGIFKDLFALVEEEATNLESVTGYQASINAHEEWKKRLVEEMLKVLDMMESQDNEVRLSFARALHNIFLHDKTSYIYAVWDKASREFPKYVEIAEGLKSDVDVE